MYLYKNIINLDLNIFRILMNIKNKENKYINNILIRFKLFESNK